MASKSIAQTVEELAKPIVEELGYELVEVDYSKKYTGMVLTLYIYNEQGISLDDCEKVSKAVDGPLDELNPTNDVSYSLNVSSLGIDRPIKSADDCRRNIGTEVEVKLYAPINGVKTFTGIITSFNNNSYKIKNGENEYEFEFKKVANCTPIIKF